MRTSYNYEKKKLLLTAYVCEMENLLEEMKVAAYFGEHRQAAKIGLVFASKATRAYGLKKELATIRKKLKELDRAAKFNLYAGGDLHT